MIGYLYQRSAEKDGNESTKNIMEGALSNHHDRLLFSYEMLMIIDKGSEPDLNERSGEPLGQRTISQRKA